MKPFKIATAQFEHKSGDKNYNLQVIEQLSAQAACEEHEPLLLCLKYQRWVPDSLKEDPRFQKILDTVGFP